MLVRGGFKTLENGLILRFLGGMALALDEVLK